MRKNSLFLTAAGFVVGVALTIAAGILPARSAIAQPDAYAAAQKAQVMAVIFMLDRAGLHDLDESLAAGKIPSGALGNIRRARTALLATDWPAPLRDKAMELANHMNHLEGSLRAEDAAAAAPHGKEVHEVEHDLSALVYDWLRGGAAPSYTGPVEEPSHGEPASKPSQGH